MNVDSAQDFGVVLNKLGNCNKYTIKTYSLLLVVVYFYGLHQTTFVFVAPDINYRCEINECENSGPSYVWLNYTIPTSKGELSKCKRYAPKQIQSGLEKCSPDLFDNATESACTSFIYSDEDSIVRDFNLACQDGKRTLLGTVNFIGNLGILPIIAIFSDKYGRKVTLITAIVTLGVLGVIKSFSLNYEMMLVLEFFGSGLGLGAYTTAFVFAMELVQPKKRVAASTVLHIVFSLGHVTYAGLAWYLQNWRNLLRVMGGPTVLFISYFWIIDESVRWLLSKNKKEEAIKVIKKAARINKVHFGDNSVQLLTEAQTNTKTMDSKGETTLVNAIKSHTIRKRLIICSVLYVTCNFVYYGLTINSVSLAGNKYLNFLLVAVSEIPSNLICIVVLDKFGRRKTLVSSFVLSGIFCVSITFLTKEQRGWSILLYLLGMLCICMAFVSVYTYASELFPTTIRQTMISICSFCGRVGSMLSALTPLLAMHNEHLPAIIFGGLALLAGSLVLALPETNNIILPDTINEAERICQDKEGDRIINF